MAQTTYEDPIHVIELTPEFLRNYDLDIPTVVEAGLSTIQLADLLREMGARGRAVTKRYGGRYYLILKGHAGLRPNLTGTRYALTNPKIVAFGIGAAGQAISQLKVTVVGFILAAGIEILEAILNDRTTLADFVGDVVTELAKVGLASIAATAAGLLVGGTTTLTAAPVVVSIAVGVGAGIGLNALDNEYRISDRVSAVIQQLLDKTVGEAARLNGQIERRLIDQALRRAGIPY